MPFTTVILRFRDLVTSPHDTIRLHTECISANQHVWWGWWSKAGERIPDDAFRQLADAAAATAEGVRVLLMDSGSGRVYEAACTDLVWDPRHTRIKSPAVEATPAYYRDQDYFAWFRFTGIEAVNPSVLGDLSYVRVDEFFEEGESRYGPFYDKRVHSIQELRQQDRTIWFVRPALATDASHQVSLLDTRTIAPAHFPNTFIQSSSRTLLWISDPHLTSSPHHGFPLKGDATSNDLGFAIEKACRDAQIDRVAGVLISGDLSWCADPDEYQLVRDFVARLNVWAKLDNYAYAFCPGNHDIKFSADPADKGQPVSIAGPASIDAYTQLYQSSFYLHPNNYLSCGRRFLLGNTTVEVVLLNSSYLQQGPDVFQGHGFVGDDQLRHAAEQFNWYSTSERAVRILVVHHHLLPVTFREAPQNGRMYSVALDAEAIMRWVVRCRVDLVLHGHMHQPFWARVTRGETPNADTEHPFTIIGAGSAGVALAHLGEQQQNTFATLTFARSKIVVKTYSLHPVNPSNPLWTVEVPVGGG